MILRPKDKKHAEEIIKHCVENGMDKQVANLAFWNHLVKIFKKIELLEERVKELKNKHREACPRTRNQCSFWNLDNDAKCHYQVQLCGAAYARCWQEENGKGRTSCAKGEESPAQNTMEICHTAPNSAMPGGGTAPNLRSANFGIAQTWLP